MNIFGIVLIFSIELQIWETTKIFILFKGTVSLFGPRGPEIALTFLMNEFIVKL